MPVLKTNDSVVEQEKSSRENHFSSGTESRHSADFIEMAAHDLQAPLRKLEVLTDRLMAKYESLNQGEIGEYTRRIHGCIAGMRSLIEGFTDLAACVPRTMQYETCNTEEIIKAILKELASRTGREAVVNMGKMPVVQGDRTQFRLMFKELLENSFLFHKPGNLPELCIHSEILSLQDKAYYQLPAKRVYYKICIEDNGIGFEAENAERIFQPLVKLQGKSAFPENNGLGLTLVRKVAENHGGIVYATGGEEGARVFLIIPENHD